MGRRLIMMAAATGAILCILWSFAASWAAAYPARPDYYRVTVFGVQHISDTTAHATETRCGWHQRLDACAPAIGGESHYASVARGRWFVFAGLLFTLIGVALLRMRDIGPWAATPFVLAALSIGAAITLVRSNVPTALAAFAGARVEINGSGVTAAEIAAGLCFIAAIAAVIPALRNRADTKPPA